MNKKRFMIVSAMMLMSSPLLAATHTDGGTGNRTVVTNLFRDNWVASFGIDHMSFYSSEESGLSKNPFASFRSTFSASASIGKWFTPEIGLRTKANGYWGRRILGEDRGENKIKFFCIQEQVMLNLSSLLNGYDATRLYNAIPFGGVGFVRDCTNNDNSISATLGLSNNFRLTNQLHLHFDLSCNFAGNKQDDAEAITGRFHWFAAEIGATFNLGKHTWNKGETGKVQPPVFVYDEYTALSNRRKAAAVTEQVTVGQEDVPTGMVLVPRGHVRMGIEDADTLWGRPTPVRDISVDDFWMDRTEVTNKQYREFVNYVIDSTVNHRMNDPQYFYDREKVLESLYTKNPVTGERVLDRRQLLYRYEVYDYAQAALRKHNLNPSERNLNTDRITEASEVVLISKDTAYVDLWGNVIRESITRPLSGAYDFLNTYIVSVYPDTTCWVNDFPNADNEMYLRYYWSRKEYEDYPVVGVTWEQANAYCAWRTEMMYRENGYNTLEQRFRLPTEAEWEYAARGRYQNEFPWAREFAGKGCYFANYMSEEGDLTKDGNIITSVVGAYAPNTNGLFDMAGNVAEWTSTAYNEAGVEIMNVINPEIRYDAAPEDPYMLKRKTVKGGSWKDPESHVRSAWRTAEYQNQPRSYIGFRCVRSLATKQTQRAVILPGKKSKLK